MICNRCVKQDVCLFKALAEKQEKELEKYPFIEIDCRHRELATQAQMQKIKEREEYALPDA